MIYYIVFFLVLIVAAYLYISLKGKPKKNANKSMIFIVGEKGAGKTSLLYCVFIDSK